MVASSPLPTTNTVARLEQAALDLQDARVAHLGAVTAHAEARRYLDGATAREIVNGLEGKNQAERDAHLRMETHELHKALHSREDELAEARCRLACAETEFRVARLLLEEAPSD